VLYYPSSCITTHYSEDKLYNLIKIEFVDIVTVLALSFLMTILFLIPERLNLERFKKFKGEFDHKFFY